MPYNSPTPPVRSNLDPPVPVLRASAQRSVNAAYADLVRAAAHFRVRVLAGSQLSEDASEVIADAMDSIVRCLEGVDLPRGPKPERGTAHSDDPDDPF